MKKGICLMLAIALALLSMEGLAEGAALPGEEQPHILIAYFSRAQEIYPTDLDGYSAATPRVNNTELLALKLQELTGADLFQIQTERVYPVEHSANSEIAGREKEEDARPVLVTHVENMELYDTILLGYPLWWYTAPMAVRTFLEEYDFSGKRIVPYATSLGAGISESLSDIARLCPDAVVEEGLLVTNGSADRTDELTQWLERLNIAMTGSEAESDRKRSGNQ